ncbi:MAG: hypothetical protein ACRDQU_13510 [Pseudonocardiaceae bacterium]
MTEAIRALQRLREAGFGGFPIMDSLGQLDALFLSFAHRGAIDCLLVHGETDAIASRVRDELDPRNSVLWTYAGDLVAAVNELLDLPAPGERGAPNNAGGGPSELWIPPGANSHPSCAFSGLSVPKGALITTLTPLNTGLQSGL